MHRHLPLTITIILLVSGSVLLAQQPRRRALLVPMQEDTLTLPPELERKQQQWLKEQLALHPGDEEVIAIIGNEEVTHGLVRSQTVVYQDGIATLSAQEAYDKALVVVLASKAQRLKALEQEIEVSPESVQSDAFRRGDRIYSSLEPRITQDYSNPVARPRAGRAICSGNRSV